MVFAVHCLFVVITSRTSFIFADFVAFAIAHLLSSLFRTGIAPLSSEFYIRILNVLKDRLIVDAIMREL